MEGQAPPTWVPGVVPVQDCPCSPSANGLLSRHHSFMSDPVVWLGVQMKPHFLLWDSKNENVVGAVLRSHWVFSLHSNKLVPLMTKRH